jgi:integrase
VSVDFDSSKQRWRVRWREQGRQRTRRFSTREEAHAFDESLRAEVEPTRPERAIVERAGGNAIYAYSTKAGVRYRFAFRQSDGKLSTRRGFTCRRAAATARRRLVESIERGEVKVARESFETFWLRLLEERRPYMTKGSAEDFETHGRKRLLPSLGATPLARVDEQLVRRWMDEMVALVESGELAPKTVNNARTCLSVALNEAERGGLLSRNPCTGVPALPVDRAELDYLRLDEIEPYVDACAAYYRPLASFLIGTGARISEALDVRFRHLDVEQGVVRIYRQQGRRGDASQPTKGKRFRAVQIGPRLAGVLTELREDRRAGPDDWLFLCPPPRRGRYAGRTEPTPPNRRTVHDWHEAALVDAGQRDMPLHALRHTAAAAWLATGHPLIFVQRQLGHRSITTTEEHYGHLESSFVREAAFQTERAIEAARPGQAPPLSGRASA